MRDRRSIFVCLLCIFLVAGILSAPAGAQAPTPKVNLKASRNLIEYGQRVQLTGRIRPPSPGQQVNIVSDGRVIASDMTNDEGRYKVRIKPSKNKTVRAQWAAAVSGPEKIRVKPKVRTYLGKVNLFSKARVHGRVAPAHKGERIKVRLVKDGRTLVKKRVKLGKGGAYSTRFRIRTMAPVQARASIDDADHARGVDRSNYKAAKAPYLTEGSRGRYVKILERRLSKLGYRLGDVNRTFDYTTRDALIAFHKVQGLPRIGDAADYTWRALLRPYRPKPASTSGYHFEIDQTKQVLYIVRKGKVRTIVHVSTGANGYTHDGVWTVYRQLDGYSGGGLYYPSYFHDRRAVHGWSDVPTYPASHGCVRTPMWIAPWLNDKAFIGMTVRIYHS